MRGCLSKVAVLLIAVVVGASWLGSAAPVAAWDVEVDRPDYLQALQAFPCYWPSVGGYDEIDCSFTLAIPYGGHVTGQYQCDGFALAATQHFRNYSDQTGKRIIVVPVDGGVPTLNVGPDAASPWGASGHAQTCAFILAAAPSDGSLANVFPPQPFDVYDIKQWAVFGTGTGDEEPFPDPTPAPTPTPGGSPTPTPDPTPDYVVQCGYTAPSQSCSTTTVRYVRDGPTVAPDALAAGEHFRITLEIDKTSSGGSWWGPATTSLPSDGTGRAAVVACTESFGSSGSPLTADVAEHDCIADFETPRTSRSVDSTSFIIMSKGLGGTSPIQLYTIFRWYRIGVEGTDTDGDGWSDQWELDHGTDPDDINDYPGHPAPSATPTPTPAASPTPVEGGTVNPPPPYTGFDVCAPEFSASGKLLCSDDDVPPGYADMCEGPDDALLAGCQPVEPWDGPLGGGGGTDDGVPGGGGTGGSGVTDCEPTPVTGKVGFVAYDSVPDTDDLAARVEGKDPLGGLGESLGWIGDMVWTLPSRIGNAIKWLWNQGVDAVVPGACLDAIIETRWDELGTHLPLSLFFDAKDAIDASVAGAGVVVIPGVPLPGGGSLAFPLDEVEADVAPYRGVMGAAVYLLGFLAMARIVAGSFGVAKGNEQLTLGL